MYLSIIDVSSITVSNRPRTASNRLSTYTVADWVKVGKNPSACRKSLLASVSVAKPIIELSESKGLNTPLTDEPIIRASSNVFCI